jgi:hypothetical protein
MWASLRIGYLINKPHSVWTHALAMLTFAFLLAEERPRKTPEFRAPLQLAL